MVDMISSGFIDLILALVVVEAIALGLWRMKTGSGPAVLSLLCNLLAGAFLLLALRNALAGASALSVAACLFAAFVAHLLDIRSRWEFAASRAASRSENPVLKATLSLRVSEQKSRPARRAQTEE